MRVVFLTHYYPPEVGAPQARVSGIAGGLSELGVEVTVHTCAPHYPDGIIRAPHRNRPWMREAGPPRVLRSAVYPAPNRGFGRRVADHASFALSALATVGLTGPADAIVVETPPLFLAGAAIAYARIKRAPLVVHVADLWPDSAIELGALRRRRAIEAARALERACYRAAAAIACPTEGIREELERRPESRSKVVRIAPSVDVDRFDAIPARRGPGFRVLYAGTVGMAQGLETLVDAAALLNGGPEGVRIVIAGDGADAPTLRERLAGGGPSNVSMVGAVPHDAVAGLYADADAAVVLLRDRPLFRHALPSKMLEAMAAARPLVLSAEGEAARLIVDGGCGLAVPPERPTELAAAIAALARDPEAARRMGAAGRALAVERFGRERAVADWADLLARVSSR